nr:MICOS complex subunit MIC27-like [Saimiri boliviensis boliviensis]
MSTTLSAKVFRRRAERDKSVQLGSPYDSPAPLRLLPASYRLFSALLRLPLQFYSKEAYSDRPKSLSKNGVNRYVTGKKIYATSQQIFETVKSLWTKSNKKETLPQPKEKTKLGSSAEIEVSGKTTHVLKHSVPLPTELSSEAKTKSVSTSGATQFMPDPKLMDHGQSYPEDIDMYSTRS